MTREEMLNRMIADLAAMDDAMADSELPAEVQLRGINTALRIILRCADGESILRRAATVIRRADRLAAAHPEFGPI